MGEGKRGPLSAVLAHWGARRRKQIAGLARRVARSCKVDDVHDLRTLCRRIRAFSVLFADDPLLASLDLARPAKRVMKLLAGLRECDVALDRLNELSGDTSDADVKQARRWLQRRIRRTRKKCERKARPAVRKRARRLASALRALRPPRLNGGMSPEAAARLTARIAEHAERTRTLIRRLGPRPAWPQMHETRVAAKYWRYAVEFLREYEPQADAGLAPLVAVQDLGGRAQDLGDLIARIEKAQRRMAGHRGRKAQARWRGLSSLAETARAARQDTAGQFLQRARVLLADHGQPTKRTPSAHVDGDARTPGRTGAGVASVGR